MVFLLVVSSSLFLFFSLLLLLPSSSFLLPFHLCRACQCSSFSHHPIIGDMASPTNTVFVLVMSKIHQNPSTLTPVVLTALPFRLMFDRSSISHSSQLTAMVFFAPFPVPPANTNRGPIIVDPVYIDTHMYI